ncbi:hypothetical protein FZ983_31855 [Azospirillum sp. B21]|uniref:hypothetical protein n=1 Tax=Azospirillum sp. B21 TaxID=2607496 RepID=UPI0011EC6558|nr:hypothetical protein [Azospirillum sp. B21]KAA0572541.1 hypothetical protein FZ983_31855 [Azospirillum sp. B21]
MSSSHRKIMINRAPVLTLWATVVAERLGLDHDEALTMGKALSGLTAHAKGVRLGIFEPTPETVSDQRKALQDGDEIHLHLMGRSIPTVHTKDGLRAVRQGKLITPASVNRYLAGKFGDDLEDVRQAMTVLAHSLPPADLARQAFRMYEAFRPDVKAGTAGWGAEGELDLAKLAPAARS